jgi:hypothetical protein
LADLPTDLMVTHILAGNSRVELVGGSECRVDAQLHAFDAALIRADEFRALTGELPVLSIAFDHPGVFRKQFLREGLTNSRKRHPRLSDLRPEITDIFAGVAMANGISLDDILVIHEDSARTQIEYLITTTPPTQAVLRRLIVQADSNGGYDNGDDRPKITCAALTSEYFRRAARPDTHAGEAGTAAVRVLEVFFENDPWSEPKAYVRGLQISQALGADFTVRLKLVGADDTVHAGGLVSPLLVR